MKILIYGAGVIGSIFAGKIARKGYDVTVLARGNRYNELKEKGIILKNCLSEKIIGCIWFNTPVLRSKYACRAVVHYLPIIVLANIWKIIMKTKIAEYAMAMHTIVGREEIIVLEKQFKTLNKNKIELENYNEI